MRAAVLLWALIAVSYPIEANDSDAFERLETLVGSWQGSFTWSGARSGGGELDVEYSLTGAGSALVENHLTGSGSLMSSIYHRDGGDLRLTHYCAARNQPRMKATFVSPDRSRMRFELVDITNLSSERAFHTRQIEILFRDDNHVELEFTVRQGEQESVQHLTIARRH